MKLRIGSLAMVMVLTWGTGLRAQVQDSAPSPPPITAEGAPSSDLPLADYQAFDQFAIAHPEIVSDLAHDPHLLENADYLAKHPQLRDFLSTHEELRGNLISDPGNFIEPYGRRPL